MKKFSKKVLLFIAGLFCLFVLKKLVTPYYLGNTTFAAKVRYFEKNNNEDKFNTVFFGASTTHRHLKSILFDSILQDQNLKTFNFGVDATYNPETFYLLKNFIGKKNKNEITYAFVELQGLDPIGYQNVYSTRKSYWNDLYFLNYAINYTINSNQNINKKMDYFKIYLATHLFSYVDFKILNNFFEINNELNTNSVGENGYYSLWLDMMENDIENGPRDWHETFKSDTTVVAERRKFALNALNQIDTLQLNEYYLEFLHTLIEEYKKIGVELIFVLPPKLLERYYLELLPIAKSLPQKNMIDMSNPLKYDEFYQTQYSFDKAHLNDEGATLYTNYLAEEFRKRLAMSD